MLQVIGLHYRKRGIRTKCLAAENTTRQQSCEFYVEASRASRCMYLREYEYCDKATNKWLTEEQEQTYRNQKKNSDERKKKMESMTEEEIQAQHREEIGETCGF